MSVEVHYETEEKETTVEFLIQNGNFTNVKYAYKNMRMRGERMSFDYDVLDNPNNVKLDDAFEILIGNILGHYIANNLTIDAK